MAVDEAVKELAQDGKKRFRFASFSERISRVDIDVIHRVRNVEHDEPTEGDSYFVEALLEWRELNCTAHFAEFVYEIDHYSQSLVLILYHKDRVIDILLKHLAIPDSLALEPLLALITALAHDLGTEIYHSFDKIFLSLISLLRVRDANLIEKAFATITYLFKFLLKKLVSHLDDTFRLYSNLLLDASYESYIREFAAESFAFLLRKVDSQQLSSKVKFMLEQLSEHPQDEAVDGLAFLFFQFTKGVQTQFHSKTQSFLGCIFQEYRQCRIISPPSTNEVTHLTSEKEHIHAQDTLLRRIHAVITQLLEHMLRHTLRASSHVIFDILMEELNGQLNAVELCIDHTRDLLSLLTFTITFREGKQVPDQPKLFSFLAAFLQRLKKSPYFITLEPDYFLTIQAVCNMHKTQEITSLIDELFLLDVNDTFLTRMTLLESTPLFDEFLFPRFVASLLKRKPSDPTAIVCYLAHCLPQRSHVPFQVQLLLHKLNIVFPSTIDHPQINEHLILSRYLDTKALAPDAVFSLITKILASRVPSLVDAMILALKVTAAHHFSLPNDNSNDDDTLLIDIVRFAPHHSQLLTVLANADFQKTPTVRTLEKLAALLSINLTSPCHALRQSTLHLLSRCEQFLFFPPKPREDGAVPPTVVSGPCHLLQVAWEAESTAADLQHYRERLLLLRRLDTISAMHVVPAFYLPLIVRVLLSQFSVNFSLVWSECTEMLSHVSTLDADLYFQEMKGYLARLLDDLADGTPEETILDQYQDDTVSKYDPVHHLEWLIKTLTLTPSVTQSHSALLLRTFQSFYRTTFLMKRDVSLTEKDMRRTTPTEYRVNLTALSRASTRSLLMAYLKLFESLAERVSLPLLYELLGALLMSSDTVIQQAVLNCLFAFQYEFLTPYQDHLRNIVKEQSFRDELCLFQVNSRSHLAAATVHRDMASSSVVIERHRPYLMPVLLRILFGKMMQKVAHQATRRVAIFSFLHSCTDSEVEMFIDLLLEPFVEVYFIRYPELFDIHSMTDSITETDNSHHELPPLRCLSATSRSNITESVFSLRKASNEATQAMQSLSPIVLLRHQRGYLHVLMDLLKQMGRRLTPLTAKLFLPLVSILYDAQCAIEHHRLVGKDVDEEEEEEKEEEEEEEQEEDKNTKENLDIDDDESDHTSLLNSSELQPSNPTPLMSRQSQKTLRQSAWRLLARWFTEGIPAYPVYELYLPTMFSLLISPRLPVFSQEHHSHATGLLEVFLAWSRDASTRTYLHRYDPRVLRCVFACLECDTVSPAVVRLVLDMAEHLLNALDEDASLHALLFDRDTISTLLQGIYCQWQTSSLSTLSAQRHLLLRRQLKLLTRLTAHQALLPTGILQNILDLLVPFLSPKAVRGFRTPLNMKGDLLRILKHSVALLHYPDWTRSAVYRWVCQLLSVLTARRERQLVCDVLAAFSLWIPTWTLVHQTWMSDLNAFHEHRLGNDREEEEEGEPDYQRRLDAYQRVSERDTYESMPCHLWLPYLHQCLHDLHRSSDMALRSHAAHLLSCFLDMSAARYAAAVARQQPLQGEPDDGKNLAVHVVLAAVRRGLQSETAMFQRDYLVLLNRFVQCYGALLPDYTAFQSLLMGGDEEANVLLNLVHLQVHRRCRATARLAQLVQQRAFTSQQLTAYFLPLILAPVLAPVDPRKPVDPALLNESMLALGVVAGQLAWPAYARTLQLLIDVLSGKKSQRDSEQKKDTTSSSSVSKKSKKKGGEDVRPPISEAAVMKALVVVLDHFHEDLKTATAVHEGVETVEENHDRPHRRRSTPRRGLLPMTSLSKTEKEKEDKDEEEENEAQEQIRDTSDEEEEDETIADEMPATSQSIEMATSTQVTPPSLPLNSKELIYRRVRHRLLPQLLDCLQSSSSSSSSSTPKNQSTPSTHRQSAALTLSTEKITSRVPLVLAMVKLLQVLPEADLAQQLPKLLNIVCHSLKTRDWDVREQLRSVLVQILQSLGPQYLGTVIRELKLALTRGYERAILKYCFFYLLQRCVPAWPNGCVDDALPDIYAVALEECLGTQRNAVSEDGYLMDDQSDRGGRKSHSESAMKETTAQRGFDTIEYLAHGMTFERHIDTLLDALKMLLHRTGALATLRRVANVLRRIQVGLMHQSDTVLADERRIDFVRRLLEQRPSHNTAAQQRVPLPLYPESCDGHRKKEEPLPLKHYVMTVHVLTEFAWSLLLAVLKKRETTPSTASSPVVDALDALVPALMASLRSMHAEEMTLALRALAQLLPWHLPAVEAGLRSAIYPQLYTLIRQQGKTGSTVVQGCLKIITVLLRDFRHVSVPEKHVRVLLQLVTPDMHLPDQQHLAFGLIKAVILRKMPVQEALRTAVNQMTDLLVRSESVEVRALARTVLFQYLLDYPLGEQDMADHFRFLAANLSYAYESGRQSVMEMLHSLLLRFPEEVLLVHAELLFLPLVVQLVNDESSACREMISQLLLQLLQRVAVHTEVMDLLAHITVSWFNAEENEGVAKQPPHSLLFVSAGAQVAGLFFEASRVLPRAPAWKEQLMRCLVATIHTVVRTKETSATESWSLLYYALNSVCKRLEEDNRSEQLVALITSSELCECVDYPHQWIRSVALKVYLLAAAKESEKSMSMGEWRAVLAKKLVYCTSQLSTATSSSEYCQRLTQLLLWVSMGEQCVLLPMLCKKLVMVGRKESGHNHEFIKRSVILAWLKLVLDTVSLSDEAMRELIATVLPLVVHLVETQVTLSHRRSQVSSVASYEELKTLAALLIDGMKTRLSVADFGALYATAKEDLREKRAQRQQTRRLDAVRDPERAAQRKQRKHLASRKNKKRALSDFQQARQMTRGVKKVRFQIDE